MLLVILHFSSASYVGSLPNDKDICVHPPVFLEESVILTGKKLAIILSLLLDSKLLFDAR
jgi:hypothetical protein